MTREEAIRMLKGLKRYTFWGVHTEEALSMAIEALETDVPGINVGDTISRQAAIDVAKEELDNGTFYDIPSKIESLPSAQPEQKTGKWIKLYPRAYKCSECKTWWEESEVDEIKQFIYCPKCGAKMEVENEHR